MWTLLFKVADSFNLGGSQRRLPLAIQHISPLHAHAKEDSVMSASRPEAFGKLFMSTGTVE